MVESAKQETKKKKKAATEESKAAETGVPEKSPAPAKVVQKRRRKRRKKSAATSAPASTVKAEVATKKTSKTQAVKSYLAKNPAAGPTEIVAALKSEGIEITPNYVSNLKFHLKAKRKGRKPTGEAKAAAPRAAKSPQLTIASLVAAKKAADALGGVQSALQALQALSQLLDAR